MEAERVKAIRAALGLTLKDFAGRLGVTLRAVQYWEAGTREPGGAAVKVLESIEAKAKRRAKSDAAD